MQAYRDRYAEIQKQNGRVLAISTDDVETLKKWRAELNAPQTFIADPDGRIVRLFDTKMAIVNVASRKTFVVGPGRKVLEIQEGGDAIDAAPAVRACGLHKDAPAAPAPAPASMPDAGR
jgi:peroxiredoxin